jgi:hypothetical protein
MAPTSQTTHPHQLQRRWTNADGEKVGLWISLGIIITIILFIILLGTLNISMGKPLSKLREFEKDKSTRDTRAETLTAELADLRTQLATKTEECETAKRNNAGADRMFATQQQLAAQLNERIASLNRERDEKVEELRVRTVELAESRLFGTERATECGGLRNNLRDGLVERNKLDRECDRLRMQLSFAAQQLAARLQAGGVMEWITPKASEATEGDGERMSGNASPLLEATDQEHSKVCDVVAYLDGL